MFDLQFDFKRCFAVRMIFFFSLENKCPGMWLVWVLDKRFKCKDIYPGRSYTAYESFYYVV